MDWDYLVTAYVQPIPISSYVYIYIMQYQSINDIQWSLVYLSYCILWIIINPSNCRPARPMNSSMDGFLVSMLFTGSSNSRTPVMSDMSVWRVVSAKTSVWWTATAAVCRGAMHQSYCRNEWSFYVTCLMKICNITRFQHDFRDESSSAYGCGSKLGTLS